MDARVRSQATRPANTNNHHGSTTDSRRKKVLLRAGCFVSPTRR